MWRSNTSALSTLDRASSAESIVPQQETPALNAGWMPAEAADYVAIVWPNDQGSAVTGRSDRQFAPAGGRYPQGCQERTFVSPSTAMQNDADGHDTDLRPMPEFTIVGADHELPL